MTHEEQSRRYLCTQKAVKSHRGETKSAFESYGVLTLAYGEHKYIEMAKNLARSLVLHSPEIPRAVVTDSVIDRELNKLFTHHIPLCAEWGTNFRQKLHIDYYSPFDTTLFIDSDCLAMRDISFIFDLLRNTPFAAVGSDVLLPGQRDPNIDVDFVLKKYGLVSLPKFNGGVYYFNRSDRSRNLFNCGRMIMEKWKENGIKNFRGDGPPDEPIISLAMSLNNIELFDDDKIEIMRTPIGLKGKLKVDVLKARCTFYKNDRLVSPAILHFAGEWQEMKDYRRECLKLKMIAMNYRIYRLMAHTYPNLIYAFPGTTYFRNILPSLRNKIVMKMKLFVRRIRRIDNISHKNK